MKWLAAYCRAYCSAPAVWAANDDPGRKYKNVTIVVDRSREPGNFPSVLGTGAAPESPAIGAPRGWPASRAAALRTALTCTFDDSPVAARWTIATPASSGA